jgi:hypothetical protein
VGLHHAQQGGQSEKGWLDLEQIANVEVTSEGPSFPIESAFGSDDGPGWRASQGGEQQIRIIFDQPLSVHRMELRFDETGCAKYGWNLGLPASQHRAGKPQSAFRLRQCIAPIEAPALIAFVAKAVSAQYPAFQGK